MKNRTSSISPVLPPVFWVALSFWCAAVPALGQSFGRVEQTQSNSKSYYYYVQPGTQSIQISVLGMARNPGLYEVNQGTTMQQLLALSGGPNLDRTQSINRQKTTVQLLRPSVKGRTPLYQAPLETTVADTAAAIALKDGDVLTMDVTEKRPFDWRDILTIVNVASIVVLIVINVQHFHS
jgi:hypothetical protein